MSRAGGVGKKELELGGLLQDFAGGLTRLLLHACFSGVSSSLAGLVGVGGVEEFV